MQSLFGLVSQPQVEISLSDENVREMHSIKGGKAFPLYYDGESVTGKVKLINSVLIKIPNGRRFEHLGIKAEFIGQIVLFHERGTQQEFFTTSQELAAAGEISATSTMDFDFKSIGPFQIFGFRREIFCGKRASGSDSFGTLH